MEIFKEIYQKFKRQKNQCNISINIHLEGVEICSLPQRLSSKLQEKETLACSSKPQPKRLHQSDSKQTRSPNHVQIAKLWLGCGGIKWRRCIHGGFVEKMRRLEREEVAARIKEEGTDFCPQKYLPHSNILPPHYPHNPHVSKFF